MSIHDEHIIHARRLLNAANNTDTLMRAFYIARYGKANVKFKGNVELFEVRVNPAVDKGDLDNEDDLFAIYGEPLLAFDEELTREALVDIIIEDDGTLISELASYYALMGGE